MHGTVQVGQSIGIGVVRRQFHRGPRLVLLLILHRMPTLFDLKLIIYVFRQFILVHVLPGRVVRVLIQLLLLIILAHNFLLTQLLPQHLNLLLVLILLPQFRQLLFLPLVPLPQVLTLNF